MNIISSILEYIFPTKCIKCKNIGSVLCDKCLGKIPEPNQIPDSFVHACFSYKDSTVKYALWLLKYHGRFPIAKILGKSLYEHNIDILSEKNIFNANKETLIIPIPITRSRKRMRGYNQSALLARAFIENLTDKEFLYGGDILEKIRDTKAQAKVRNRLERLRNLQGAYKIKSGVDMRGKNVILIDDVYTTGATLKEARRVLREAGARNIIALVVAH